MGRPRLTAAKRLENSKAESIRKNQWEQEQQKRATDELIRRLENQLACLDRVVLFTDAVWSKIISVPAQCDRQIDYMLRANEQSLKTAKLIHNIRNPQSKTTFIKNNVGQQLNHNQLVAKTEELERFIEAAPIDAIEMPISANLRQ